MWHGTRHQGEEVRRGRMFVVQQLAGVSLVATAEFQNLPQRMSEAQTKADEHKAKGNVLVGQERFSEAAEEYSAAIALTPENHVLYANRAACYVSKALDRGEEALVDATRCVELAPWWAKGWARKAQAQCLLKQYLIPQVVSI